MPQLALYCYLMTCVFLLCTVTQGATNGGSQQMKDNLPTICQVSCGPDTNKTQVGKFCSTTQLGSDKGMVGRCCVNKTDNTVLGIDLEKCNLTREQFSTGIQNMSDLLYISLQGNSMKQVTREDFHRNTHILYLSLPLSMDCPGSHDSWGTIKNSTADHVKLCLDELDVCTVHNVTCPENSECVHSGVDLTECLCKEGFHGYKCMNQGTFPTAKFVVGVALPTIVLSALLWLTQRRYVKTTNKKK